VIDVAWTFADDPHRVGAFEMHFHWPSLSPKRLEAAKRVAQMCTIHTTFEHPPAITIEGTAGEPLIDGESTTDDHEPVAGRGAT
jgi:hypothetical protein